MKPGGNWGAGVLVMNSKKEILIGLRTDTKDWCTPGGRVQPGETPLHGVIRECREESNLRIKNPRFIGTQVDDNNGRLWISFMFIAKDFKGNIKPQESEIVKWEWKPLNEVKKMKLFKPTKEMLEFCESKELI